jgi:hypothetical protein
LLALAGAGAERLLVCPRVPAGHQGAKAVVVHLPGGLLLALGTESAHWVVGFRRGRVLDSAETYVAGLGDQEGFVAEAYGGMTFRVSSAKTSVVSGVFVVDTLPIDHAGHMAKSLMKEFKSLECFSYVGSDSWGGLGSKIQYEGAWVYFHSPREASRPNKCPD